jgi:hypothetical protein
MATKVDTYKVDDLDGSKPAKTVRFAVDGVEREIDLSEENARKFYDFLDRYIKEGRLVSGRGSRAGRAGHRSKERHEKLQAARKWLREQGHDIPQRGRIHQKLLDEFEAAQTEQKR